MRKFLTFFLALLIGICKAQVDVQSKIKFTSNLQDFEQLSAFKESLRGVEIVALGENTHGLGEVFSAKVDLVQFLHEELGFNLVLFESGYGDAALAWERIDSQSAESFTKVFSSNFYYHSQEIQRLVEYAQTRDQKLILQGFDCQPQQNYLIRTMAEIVEPLDSLFAKSVKLEMRSFNKMYQFENDKDSLSFYNQRDQFIAFLDQYDRFLEKNEDALMRIGTSQKSIEIIRQSNKVFRDTYSVLEFGELMGWPASADFRDHALFELFSGTRPKIRVRKSLYGHRTVMLKTARSQATL